MAGDRRGPRLLAGIGARRIEAVEIGNEPSNYSRFPWYWAGGHAVYARPRTYSFNDFVREFSAIRAGLPGVPLAGPALGGYGWLAHLGAFLHAEPSISTVTFHRYPLNRCFARPGSRIQATLFNLLSPFAARGFLAPVRPSVRLAHARGARFRLDEFNSVSCSGKFGLSDRFASALWVLDALFEAARNGIDGVNIHTFPGAAYAPFDLRRSGAAWSAVVRPEYYGMLLFARAAPAGAALLSLSGTSTSARVRVWATRGRDGTVRAVIINKNQSATAHVAIRIPGAAGPASVERLTAPTALAGGDVTLAGQQFATPSRTGHLAGARRAETIWAHADRYGVTLPPASAAMLTLPAFR